MVNSTRRTGNAVSNEKKYNNLPFYPLQYCCLFKYQNTQSPQQITPFLISYLSVYISFCLYSGQHIFMHVHTHTLCIVTWIYYIPYIVLCIYSHTSKREGSQEDQLKICYRDLVKFNSHTNFVHSCLSHYLKQVTIYFLIE